MLLQGGEWRYDDAEAEIVCVGSGQALICNMTAWSSKLSLGLLMDDAQFVKPINSNAM